MLTIGEVSVELGKALLAGLGGQVPLRESDVVQLGLRLANKTATFHAAFPTVHVDAASVAARIGEELRSAGLAANEADQALEEIHFDDLCIAMACATGDSAAIAHFSGRVLVDAQSNLGRFRNDGVVESDVRSAVHERLFVADASGRPGILKYGGRGPLLGWLRVVVTRLALNLRRSKKSEESREEDIVRELLGDLPTPELELVKQDAARHFKEAFAEAALELPEDERDALRMHLYEGLSIDDLARIFDVHRATAARWLGRARDRLHAVTRERLMTRLRCSESEVDSVVKLMMSRVDLSLSRVLAARDEDPLSSLPGREPGTSLPGREPGTSLPGREPGPR